MGPPGVKLAMRVSRVRRAAMTGAPRLNCQAMALRGVARPPRIEARPAGRQAGTGVFALEPIAAGTTILHFVGPHEATQHAHTIQLGPGVFLGRSGGTDDFVN